MPKTPETQKVEYIKLEDLPKAKRGVKEIPQEWTETIKHTPVGQAMKITDLKYTTVQGRIRNLVADKKLDETYRVMQRKVGQTAIVYIAHNKPE